MLIHHDTVWPLELLQYYIYKKWKKYSKNEIVLTYDKWRHQFRQRLRNDVSHQAEVEKDGQKMSPGCQRNQEGVFDPGRSVLRASWKVELIFCFWLICGREGYVQLGRIFLHELWIMKKFSSLTSRYEETSGEGRWEDRLMELVTELTQRESDSERVSVTDRYMDWQTVRQTESGRVEDKQTDRQTDRQTEGQIETCTDG
jgi:hypothetical protein